MSKNTGDGEGLARVEARLRQVLTTNWGGAPLTAVPELLAGCNWRAHSRTLKPLLLRFPETVRLTATSAGILWAVLVDDLLLPAVAQAYRRIKPPPSSLDEFQKHGGQRLSNIARMSGRQDVRELSRDAGLPIAPPASVAPSSRSSAPSAQKAKKPKYLSKATSTKMAQSPSTGPKQNGGPTTAPTPPAQSAVATGRVAGSAPGPEIVCTVPHCREAVQTLLNDHPLAIDLECDLWGDVSVCLVQIATKSGKCFLFDLLHPQGGANLFSEGGLGRVLEDVNVLKVGHDLRSDAAALYRQFSVFLNGIFDLQVGHASLDRSPRPQQASLNTVLQQYAGAENVLKPLVKMAWEDDPGYWRRRPFTPEMIAYAVDDVRYLLQATDEMRKALESKGLYKHVLSYSRTRADLARTKVFPSAAAQTLALDSAAEPFEEEEWLVSENCFIEEGQEDLSLILDALPARYGQALSERKDLQSLVEIVMDLGRCFLARFSSNGAPYVVELEEGEVTCDDLDLFCTSITHFDSENRAGISRTLHRISQLQNRAGEVVGLTVRVGKTIHGLVHMISDVLSEAAKTKNSILLLGAPGMGKTSVIREMARVLADGTPRRSVMIVDTSNEIAGDGDVPHPAIGSARRMQVPRAVEQHKRMVEAVQNHTPDVIIVDEIGVRDEAAACCTISRRGVMLISTAHGVTLKDVVDNPSLNGVVGGVESVILSDRAMNERQLQQKTVREVKGPSAFGVAIELKSRTEWIVHRNVHQNVSLILADKPILVEIRTHLGDGRVTAARKLVKAVNGYEQQDGFTDDGYEREGTDQAYLGEEPGSHAACP